MYLFHFDFCEHLWFLVRLHRFSETVWGYLVAVWSIWPQCLDGNNWLGMLRLSRFEELHIVWFVFHFCRGIFGWAVLGKILFKTCWFRMELLFWSPQGASLILHQVGLCRALLGQAAWQSAAASLVGLDQGVHWQSVVFHHPGPDYHDESRRNPHLYKLGYLYPALTVAWEGSWSLVRSHRDSKKWENHY